MVPTFTPVFNSGRLLLSFCLFCHNTTSLCFSTPPAGGSLKSIACGRPYLINVYPELLQHFNEPGSFWCRVSLPIVYSGLMVVFGTQIETGGKEWPERLGRVSNFSSLTCSVFRYLADRRHCLKLLPWYGIPFSSGSAVLVFLWNVLAGKIFSLSIAWTADVAWKCLKAVLETQQSPGECPASPKQCCFPFWHKAPSASVMCWCGGELLRSWSGPFLTCCSALGAFWRSADNRSGWEWSSSAWSSCQAGQALLDLAGEVEATCAAGSHHSHLSKDGIDEQPWSLRTG